MSPSRHRTRGADDRGVVLVLVALLMTAMLIITALVLDYGNVRNTRQDTKRVADVATAAGTQKLAPDGVPRPWEGVCGALTFLQANLPGTSLSLSYSDGAGGSFEGGNPCNPVPQTACDSEDSSTWAWIRATSGDLVADIRSGYVTPDSAFPEDGGPYLGDDEDPCKQVAVIIADRDPVLFGGVAGADEYGIRNRSVGRVEIDDDPNDVPAFLMLERNRCDVLSEQVGTGGGQGIIVEPATATEPGMIHADSAGRASAGCSGVNSPNGWVVYSSGIGSNPGIIAKPSADGKPGILAIHALELGVPPAHYAASQVPPETGVSPMPTPGGVVSRQVVDDKYNSPGEPTITNLHSAGYTDANRSAAPAAGVGALGAAVAGTWRTLSCGDDNGVFTETKIFVNCAVGYSPTQVTFANATDIIFNGPVQVTGAGPTGRELYMPGAQRVVIGGDSTRGLEVTNGGRLGVNSVTPFTDTNDGVSAACAGREGPAWPNTTRMVVFGGSNSGSGQGGLNVAGRAALCQTFVYLAGPKASTNSTYRRQAITDKSYDPTCTPDKPCPKGAGSGNTISHAQVIVQGYLRWSAPNQRSDQPPEGAVGVEDLALWTETHSLTEVKSGGVVEAFGVYFLPNARAEMRSPASATPRDAQFIARSLQLKQGTLQMKPTPGNAVQIPRLAGTGMVR